ncbi:hypothetical protein [Nitrospira moscoviensis]|uniref:Uncharacterized protein n=1 Tax=Nitrospira moscoviensis TaxID=42253 RepID=A0A0K2G8E2_NITMO|nr:hypothetical protein [Nitrospira moscoviensis]ALA57205.1 hypothetical protein NITMOv2_0769 [Nitrospira moscoviensis]
MSPKTVTLHVPYADNEQQFLTQAVQAALRAFRERNRSCAGQQPIQPAPTSAPEGLSSSAFREPQPCEAELALAT